jgi:hypothetical protein
MDIVNTAPSWEDVRQEWDKANQMAGQSVLQAVKVGKMLIALKSVTPHGEWLANLTTLLSLQSASASNMFASRLMRMAKNEKLIYERQPKTMHEALRLIGPARKGEKKARPPSLANILVEEGVTRGTYGGGNVIKAKKELEEFDPGLNKCGDEQRMRESCRRFIAAKQPQKAAEQRNTLTLEAQEASAALPKTAQQKLDAALEKWKKAKLAEMRMEFQQQLDAALAQKWAEIDAIYKKTLDEEREAKAHLEAARSYREGVGSHMSYEDFRLVLNCLHPDRAPEDRRDKFMKAFQAFQALEKTVNRGANGSGTQEHVRH